MISKSQKCAWLVSAPGTSQVSRNRRTNLSMPTIGESSVAGSTEDEDYLGSSSFAKQRRARSCRLPKTSSRSSAGQHLLLPRRSPALQGAKLRILRPPLCASVDTMFSSLHFPLTLGIGFLCFCFHWTHWSDRFEKDVWPLCSSHALCLSEPKIDLLFHQSLLRLAHHHVQSVYCNLDPCNTRYTLQPTFLIPSTSLLNAFYPERLPSWSTVFQRSLRCPLANAIKV